MLWAVGNDAVPEQAGVPAAVSIAVAAALPVRVMVVFDYARWKDQDAALTEIRDVFLKALPGHPVAMRGCWGPFEDTEGLSSHFDGAAGRLAGVKKIRRIRVDLLISCAKVLREATGFKPQFMVGLRQGGLVVAALRWPLVVELTLQARNLQRKEARSAGEAWAGLKAVCSIRPKLWKTQSGHSEIAEACPELARDFPKPPVQGFGIKFLRPFTWMLLGAARTPASGACSTSRPESCGTMVAPVCAGNGLTCSPAVLRVSSKKLSIYSSRNQRAGRT